MIRLFGIAILANITTETATGILQATNQFKKQAALTLVNSVVTLVIITVAFVLKGDILSVLWAYLAGKFIMGLGPILLAWFSLNRELGVGWWRGKFSKPDSLKEMLSFAFSTNLSGTIKLFVSESEPLWVGLFLNTQAVGLVQDCAQCCKSVDDANYPHDRYHLPRNCPQRGAEKMAAA